MARRAATTAPKRKAWGDWQMFELQDFAGGLNLRSADEDRKPNEAADLWNVVFTDGKRIVKRAGYTNVNTTLLPGPARALRWWQPSTTSLLYAVCTDGTDGKLYEINIATGAITLRGSGLAATGTPTMAAFGSKLIVADGVNLPWFWDGTNFGHLGIAAPATACTSAAGAAGSLTGSDYQWIVTYLRADGSESNGGPASTALSLTSQAADLTTVPTSSDALVTRRNIYRIGGTLSAWYFVGDIADNTTTTYTDNLADTSAVNNAILSVMNGVPPVLAYVQPYRDRLYGAQSDSSTLFWSELLLPNAWGEGTNSVDFDPDVAGPVTGLASVASRLVVTKQQAAYSLYGDPPSNFSTTGIRIQEGTAVAGSMCYCEGVLLWLGTVSVLQTDGTLGSVIPDDADQSRWNKLQPLLAAIDRASPVASAYWQRLYLLACTSDFVQQVIAFDFLQRAWTRFDWQLLSFAEDETGHLYAGLAGSGQVAQLFNDATGSDVSDGGASIHARWQSKDFALGTLAWQKRLGSVWIEGDTSPAVPTLTIDVDEGTWEQAMAVQIAGTNTLYWDGAFNTVWDSYNWASGTSPRSRIDLPPQATGRRVRLMIDETSTSPLAVTDLALRWMPVRIS